MGAITSVLRPNDLMLIGFDLYKDPHTVASAYLDKQGLTAELSLHLLDRLNEEAGADFDRSKFEFYSYYDQVRRAGGLGGVVTWT